MMKNPALNNAILKILARVDCGLRIETLQSETAIAMNAPGMTSFEFASALEHLEDKGLVRQWISIIGYRTWGITEAGKDALKGL